MSWGEVAFDADLAATVLRDLVDAPALYAGDVELGKSVGGHAVMIAGHNPHLLGRLQQHRFGLGRGAVRVHERALRRPVSKLADMRVKLRERTERRAMDFIVSAAGGRE
jgi:hypothetical protein